MLNSDKAITNYKYLGRFKKEEETFELLTDQLPLEEGEHIRNKQPSCQGLSLITRSFSPTFRNQDALRFFR